MKQFLRFFLFVLPVVLFCVLLTRCFPTPPNVESVETCFQNNYEDLQLVVDFMMNAGYQTIDIDTTDGTMYANLETVKISNEEVSAAVKRLLGRSFIGNREYYYIYKSMNTIKVLQWKSSQQVSCGVAFSIDESSQPRIQYCTELKPLAESGWYYYVADYNAWRVGKRP